MVTFSVKSNFKSVTEGLSIRAKRVLENRGIKNTADLARLKRDDLIGVRNCGEKTIAEIKALQSKVGAPNQQGVFRDFYEDFPLEKAPKEVFDAIRDNLSVRAIHILERFGVGNLKAFMMLDKEQLLNCRDCGHKTTEEISRIQTGIAKFTRKVTGKTGKFRPETLLTASCLLGGSTDPQNRMPAEAAFGDPENPAPWLRRWVRGLARSKRDARAFMLRQGMLGFAPLKLKQVGEMVGGVSKERARQLVKSIADKAASPYQQIRLRPLIEKVAAVVKQRGGTVSLDKLTRTVLGRGKKGELLSHATRLMEFFSKLQVWNDVGIPPLKDGWVGNGSERYLFARLVRVVKKVASNKADERIANDLWSIGRGRLKAALRKDPRVITGTTKPVVISDALLDDALKQCQGRIKPYEGRIYSARLWRLRFGKVAQMVDTVLLRIGKPAHVKVIAQEMLKWRPGYSLKKTRAFLHLSDNALLWAHETFVHRDNVVIPLSMIHDVEQWLIEALQNDVPFVSINGAFLRFRSQCERAAFPSEVALYTCLRRSGHPELVYPRLPYVYLKKNFTERMPMWLAFENYLRDAGGPVSYQELKNFGMGKLFLKNMHFSIGSKRGPKVARTSDGGYLHLDNFKFDREALQPVFRHLEEILTKEEHCSVKRIYRDKRVSCAAAGIDGPLMLYSVLQFLSEDSFMLNRYPQVSKRREGEGNIRHTLRTRMLAFMRDSGRPCSYDVLLKRFVDQRGYSRGRVYDVGSERDVCLYHPGCVIHFQTLGWNEEKQHALELAAYNIYLGGLRARRYFGRVSRLMKSPALPELPAGLRWSPTMVADLLAKGKRYLVLGNAREAFLPRDNKHSIQNLETLVAKILDHDWGGKAKLPVFEAALVEAGIVKKSLTPAMLETGEVVVISKGKIKKRRLTNGIKTVNLSN